MKRSAAHPPAESNLEVISWEQYTADEPVGWVSIHQWPRPGKLVLLQDSIAADAVMKLLRQGIHIVWEGDFHQGVQLLQTIKRRVAQRQVLPANTPMPDGFHKIRMTRSQNARLMGQLLVRISTDWSLPLRRAPEIEQACVAALPALQASSTIALVDGNRLETPALMPLSQLQGIRSAYQWQKNGLFIRVLGEKVYPRYGVFAPTRQEYLDLILEASLPSICQNAIDLGTGTGVIAAILAKRSIPEILALDSQPAALLCAQENMHRLGMDDTVSVRHSNLLDNAPVADLIVCNPPWLPGAVRNSLDAAIYDPQSRMLKGFLQQAAEHLSPHGQAWLILSDLAELLNLRSRQELLTWISDAGLTVKHRYDAKPAHGKAYDPQDPLAHWRSREVTSLWQLSLA